MDCVASCCQVRVSVVRYVVLCASVAPTIGDFVQDDFFLKYKERNMVACRTRLATTSAYIAVKLYHNYKTKGNVYYFSRARRGTPVQ
jgi:hypothetical protein